jgi:uncharacterized membrane protein
MPSQGQPMRPQGQQPSPPMSQQTQQQQQGLQQGQQMPQQGKQGQDMVRSFTDQVREQATTRLHDQKMQAADGISGLAEAFRQTSTSLREGDQGALAGYVDQAADQVERFAGYLQQHEIQDFVGEMEAFARRQPLAFIGIAFGVGFVAARFFKSSQRGDSMGMGHMGYGTMDTSQRGLAKWIEVDVPVQTAYNQWTQFEEFPRFMEGVQEVRQLDDRRLHWKAQIAGKMEEWDATIMEQTPDRRIAWRSTSGARNDGVVTFWPLGPARTRIELHLDYQPEGMVENVGSLLGMVERRIDGDLHRFKQFIESRGRETGAWRGEVHGGTVTRSPGVERPH